jgi:5-methylcytosine-specific restriction endonuclease McrBC regulatory subunit McrC
MKTIRLCEYQSYKVPLWSAQTRAVVAAAAETWREAHRLSKPPLSFSGHDGCTLSAQQYVGVVEAGGVRVEIYPKLDTALVKDAHVTPDRARAVMGNLLWLLERSRFGELVDAGEAGVEESPDSFSDLLAWLFARRLRYQLSLGLPREYVSQEDDLSFVRGGIRWPRQATTHFGRPDVIACGWDEFTPDTVLSRLLRCATTLLLARTRLPGAAADLRDALAMLEDVTPCHPLEVMQSLGKIRWSRLNARWRPCHDLAVAVIRGMGREMHAGSTESFVYLLDMNRLFERYCQSWLEQTFYPCQVQAKCCVGTLFIAPKSGMRQEADFLWQAEDGLWVGDAKYKQAAPDDWPKVADIRQLICYGQLAAKGHGVTETKLMLLYPDTCGEAARDFVAYDGQPVRLQPVPVVR